MHGRNQVSRRRPPRPQKPAQVSQLGVGTIEARAHSRPGLIRRICDSIESAIYLYNREPVPEALDWIDSEMRVMHSMLRPDGHIEDCYGEGNFNRTVLPHAYMKSEGARPVAGKPGMRVGGVR